MFSFAAAFQTLLRNFWWCLNDQLFYKADAAIQINFYE